MKTTMELLEECIQSLKEIDRKMDTTLYGEGERP